MWTRLDGALSSVLSRDIPDRAGTGRLEKSPTGIAARAFLLSCNRSSEWYESNISRHHRQRSRLVRPKVSVLAYSAFCSASSLQQALCRGRIHHRPSVTLPVQSWRSDCFSLPSERQREMRAAPASEAAYGEAHLGSKPDRLECPLLAAGAKRTFAKTVKSARCHDRRWLTVARSDDEARIETKRETAMAILGAILVVAGSAIVLGCAILCAWSAYRQKRSSGPDEGSARPPEV